LLTLWRRFGDSAVLTYYYGHLSPGDNPKLYKKLTSALARAVEGKLLSDDRGALNSFFCRLANPRCSPPVFRLQLGRQEWF